MITLISYLKRIFKTQSPSKSCFDIEKIMAQSYLEGYEQGRKDERIEMIFATVTPNMIREACGLEPMKSEVMCNENRSNGFK